MAAEEAFDLEDALLRSVVREKALELAVECEELQITRPKMSKRKRGRSTLSDHSSRWPFSIKSSQSQSFASDEEETSRNSHIHARAGHPMLRWAKRLLTLPMRCCGSIKAVPLAPAGSCSKASSRSPGGSLATNHATLPAILQCIFCPQASVRQAERTKHK